MIFFISEGAQDYPDNILLSSNGPSSEKYPDSLGEYQLLPEKSHNGRPVYQSLARDDRYIIYIGNNIIYNYHNIVNIVTKFHTRISLSSLVHHT